MVEKFLRLIKKVGLAPSVGTTNGTTDYFNAYKTKNLCENKGLRLLNGGPDGTRTRDLRRDRPAF